MGQFGSEFLHSGTTSTSLEPLELSPLCLNCPRTKCHQIGQNNQEKFPDQLRRSTPPTPPGRISELNLKTPTRIYPPSSRALAARESTPPASAHPGIYPPRPQARIRRGQDTPPKPPEPPWRHPPVLADSGQEGQAQVAYKDHEGGRGQLADQKTRQRHQVSSGYIRV